MTSYYERYIAGEHEQVWSELQGLGEKVREELFYSDALAVARETMGRAKFNVMHLITKLRDLDFAFRWHPLREATNMDIAKLDDMESAVGPFPISLRAWYELISDVDLTGTFSNHDQWNHEISAIQITDQNFCLYGHKISFSEKQGGAINKVRIAGLSIMEDEVILCGDEVGTSEIVAPYLGADGEFYHPEFNIAPTFVGYLRKCFAWGGFPGFANVEESLRPTAMLEHLKEGLLPI